MKTNEELWFELKNQLSENVCEVTFTKTDGDLRIMPCTLKRELLPPAALVEHHKTKIVNYDVLSVWCIDRQAWRSFRVGNVTNVTVLP